MASSVISQKARNMAEKLVGMLAGRERMRADDAEKFLALLDGMPSEGLQLIVDLKIKFLWMPAVRRLKERGDWKGGVEVVVSPASEWQKRNG